MVISNPVASILRTVLDLIEYLKPLMAIRMSIFSILKSSPEFQKTIKNARAYAVTLTESLKNCPKYCSIGIINITEVRTRQCRVPTIHRGRDTAEIRTRQKPLSLQFIGVGTRQKSGHGKSLCPYTS